MPAFNSDHTIAQIVSDAPHAEAVLADLGIDNCCGAHSTLREHCVRLRLDPDAVVARLASSLSGGQAQHPANHAQIIREVAPRLLELARRVAATHGHRDVRLGELQGVVEILVGEHDGGEVAARRIAALLGRARELTDGFRVPAQACGSWTQLLSLLGPLHEQIGASAACEAGASSAPSGPLAGLRDGG